MNIAIFASAFHPHFGGVEELCRQLAHAVRRRGHGVVVLTNRWPRSLPRFEEYEGIPVYRPAMRVPEGGLKARLSYALTHAAVARQTLRILRRHAADVVHVQCVSSNGYYALLAARALGLPLLVSAQGERTMDAGRLYERSAFANRTLHRLLAEAEGVSACSHATLCDLEQYHGRPLGPRAAVVYNGVRLSDFQESGPFEHPRPYVLGMGRLVPQKGFDVLIQAFVRGGLPAWDLIIAGEGPERPALEQLARRLGAATRVLFLGRADRPAAVALFKGCSFFVLPSRLEPLGIVNLEAMAAGKAVVASGVGGVPEIVQHAATGLLVPPGDPDALAEAMGRLAGDAALRQRLGAQGRRRAEEFDWAVIADQYLDRYRLLLDGSARGRGVPLAGN